MKPKPKLIIFSLFLVIPSFIFSQVWDFVYDSINTMGRQIILANDGNFLATAVNNADEGASLSIKLDPDGNIIWISPNGGFSVAQTFDNKFVIAGSNHPNAVLKKIDEYGNLEWYKTYGEGSQEDFVKVIQSSDSGLVACGFTQNHGDSSFLVRKTDRNGNVLWTTCFFSMYHHTFRDLIEFDHHYYLVGQESSSSYPPHYLFIAKVTMSGVPRWHKVYESGFTGCAITVNQDSELVVAGGNIITWLNTDGDTLRTKNLLSYLDVRSIDITPENGYIISGTNESFYSVNFLSELYGSGERKWYRGYPTVAHAFWGSFGSVRSLDDGGFLACGFSLYTNQNYTRLRILKTDESGGILVGTANNNEIKPPVITPNPNDGRFSINIPGIKKVEVYDINGRLVKSISKTGEVDLTECESGIYLVRITTNKAMFKEKLIKL